MKPENDPYREKTLQHLTSSIIKASPITSLSFFHYLPSLIIPLARALQSIHFLCQVFTKLLFPQPRSPHRFAIQSLQDLHLMNLNSQQNVESKPSVFCKGVNSRED
ncbi:hypothetical protein Lalb_Chr05g0230281 [Lupinus albus]|uniref:Uncharacterized protein n=1 Tax=Lupinus albus TaxID=3870 RepID=A0A6A4QMF2_LUPAL|nr:hypothetical protein Lalb_Chr05g0230281 [Lupinus albus]